MHLFRSILPLLAAMLVSASASAVAPRDYLTGDGPAGQAQPQPGKRSGGTAPKREMRGVWVATVWGIDWPSSTGTDAAARERQQAQLTELLDRCKAMNLNTVCFQVRSMADAMYRSTLEPWSASLTGRRGADPGWDPLEWVVAECHARGLECYAWVNPFRWSAGTAYDTPHDRQWADNGWLLGWDKYTVFNPGVPEARGHVLEVCREIVDGYDIDGLLYDDYFYPNRIPETPEAPDWQLYIGQCPAMTIGDWRRANVHQALADISAMVRDTKPWVRLGVSPAGVAGKDNTSAAKWGTLPVGVKAADWQYTEIYSDPLGLMYQGTVDFISPQLYWPTGHATAPYLPLAQWWCAQATVYDAQVYPSVTLQHITAGDLEGHRAQLQAQIAANRLYGTPAETGTVIYSARYLDRVSGTLWHGAYSRPALTPALRRLQPDTPPPGPTHLRLKGGTLTWRAAKGARRYAVYAIPRDIPKAEALADDGDGLDGRWLVGVTGPGGMDITPWRSGWRYAVCAVDGAGAESAPAWID